MTRTTLFLLVGSTLAALGCGGGAGATGMYGGGGGGGGGGLTCTGATPVTLKVKNYLAWCNVSVAGDTATSASTQTVCVADGAVALAATPLAGFQLGVAPWHDVDGDTGPGTLGTVTGATSSLK